MQKITSRQNAVVSRCRAIAHKKDPSAMLLEGPHLVGEALSAGLAFECLLVSSEALERGDLRSIAERTRRPHGEAIEVSAAVMAAASPARTPSGILAVAARPSHDPSHLYGSSTGVVVIVCDMQDPGNVGAIVRAAEASGAAGMVAAGASADPFGWKALRGSMGSAFRLPIAMRPHVEEAVAEARRHGHRVVAAVPHGGTFVFQSRLTGPLALLIGGEGGGLTSLVVREADDLVTVPMANPVESLNAAVTAAVILYEARRQRGEPSTPSAEL